MKFPVVTKDDHGIRPAGAPDRCFYCKSKVGEEHGQECVVVTKRVKLKATIEFDVEVPHFWTKENIEFHRNDGTWCAQNIDNDIAQYRESTGSCMCSETKIEYVETVDNNPEIHEDELRKTAKTPRLAWPGTQG